MSKAAVQESGLSHDDIEDIDGILDSLNDLVTINLDDLKVTAVLHLIFLNKTVWCPSNKLMDCGHLHENDPLSCPSSVKLYGRMRQG